MLSKQAVFNNQAKICALLIIIPLLGQAQLSTNSVPRPEAAFVESAPSSFRQQEWASLPEAMLTAIEHADQIWEEADSSRDSRSYYYGPNCHWLALAWHRAEFRQKPRFVNYDELEGVLGQQFQAIDPADRRGGDLIVFWYLGQLRFKDEGRLWVTEAPKIAHHTAVILEVRGEPNQDLLFQKVNAQSREYRWATLADTLQRETAVARRGTGISKSHKGFELRYYRFKSVKN